MKKIAFLIFIFHLSAEAEEVLPLFRWVQLKYEGDYDPYPLAIRRVLLELVRNTSVDPVAEPVYRALSEDDLFSTPFVYLTGKGKFPSLSPAEGKKILTHVLAGGLWLVDDSSEDENSPFSSSVKMEFEKLFGEGSIKPLPPSDVIFMTFFLFRPERAEKFGLEGIEVDGRNGVIFSRNLLLRSMQDLYSMRLLINIIMYSLTTDYKRDQIHQPFIKRRLR